MKTIFSFFVLLLFLTPAVAQYAPQAGVPGSTAISASSTLFDSWATQCSVRRGYIRIDSPSLGLVSYGDSTYAVGPADHSVVSLGDSGVADLTFPGYIYNGPGADFAVFENGFINPANDSLAFLELGFVEVSSDGINYYRFPAHSLTQNATQVCGSGDYMYANLVDGFAGKYGSMYGTPFDLSDLPLTVHLNVNMITHVRIVDVIGAISGHSSTDAAGNIINDPFPTNFPSGGFDLDAVGVIHRLANAAVANVGGRNAARLYPNPASNELYVETENPEQQFTVTVYSATGVVVQNAFPFKGKTTIALHQYTEGLYYLMLVDSNGCKWVERFIKY